MDRAGCLEIMLLKPFFSLQGEGRMARKSYVGLSGHGSSTLGEESEARNRAAFGSLGQKRRAFEPFCLRLAVKRTA